MSEEPRYVNDPFGDFDEQKPGVPKWRIPTTLLQKRILAAARRKYWPPKHQNGQEIRGKIILIERAMIPLSIAPGAVWPEEWVEQCVDWFEKRNKAGYIPLKGLLTLLEDVDARTEFVQKWKVSRKEDKHDYGRDPYSKDSVRNRNQASKRHDEVEE